MENIISNLELEIKKANTYEQINQIRVSYLGKKGLIKTLALAIKDQPQSSKASYGKQVNEIQKQAQLIINDKMKTLANEKIIAEMEKRKVDISQPAFEYNKGSLHPLTIVTNKIINLLKPLGFSVEIGSEIVSDEDNFQKLNIPKDHPAREMQDTFYINPYTLLRTHNSSIQVQAMQNQKKMPIKIICPGKTYRRDDDDATHSHQFSQIDAIFVAEEVSMSDLKATLSYMIKGLFGDKTTIRFRPSYFPFTEPSVEMDLSCFICSNNSQDCLVCKGTKWVEVLGAGMVHPNVFKACNLDPSKYKGYAFGLGIERLAMLIYGVSDIREFYKNDLRFSKQFDRVYNEI